MSAGPWPPALGHRTALLLPASGGPGVPRLVAASPQSLPPASHGLWCICAVPVVPMLVVGPRALWAPQEALLQIRGGDTYKVPLTKRGHVLGSGGFSSQGPPFGHYRKLEPLSFGAISGW